MGIVHIVLFEFKPEVGHDAVQDVSCVGLLLINTSSYPFQSDYMTVYHQDLMLTFSGPGLPAHALPQGPMPSPKHKEPLRQVLRGRPQQQPRGTFGTHPTFSLTLSLLSRLPRSQRSHAPALPTERHYPRFRRRV